VTGPTIGLQFAFAPFFSGPCAISGLRSQRLTHPDVVETLTGEHFVLIERLGHRVQFTEIPSEPLTWTLVALFYGGTHHFVDAAHRFVG
jgi:hypothetical protein